MESQKTEIEISVLAELHKKLSETQRELISAKSQIQELSNQERQFELNRKAHEIASNWLNAVMSRIGVKAKITIRINKQDSPNGNALAENWHESGDFAMNHGVLHNESQCYLYTPDSEHIGKVIYFEVLKKLGEV